MKALEERLRRAAYSAEDDPDFMAAWSPLAISDLLEEAQEEIARLRVSHAEHCPAHPVNAVCICQGWGDPPNGDLDAGTYGLMGL